MPHLVSDPSDGPSDPPGFPGSRAMRERAYEPTSFSAGRDCGTRVAAFLARAAALELVDGARWWNRRRRRLMASALVACAEELEREVEAP